MTERPARRGRLAIASLLALTPAAATAEPPASISLSQAIVLAVQNNPELAVERLAPELTQADVLEQQASFDPTLGFVLGKERQRRRDLSAGGTLFDSLRESVVGEASWLQRFPTGTQLELNASTDLVDSSSDGQQLVRSRLGFTLTQPLLRETGTGANLARVRQARLDLLVSGYEVRGFTEQLVAQVERAYWEHARAQKVIDIYDASIALAERSLASIKTGVDQGALPESSRVAAESEVALRRQERVDAIADHDKARIRLLGYLGLYAPGKNPQDARFADELQLPDAPLEDVEAHVARGLRARADLNQARLQARRGDLELVRTRNGLLPRLDLFVTFGKTGYADSIGGAWEDLDRGHYGVLAGISFQRALGNHAARAEQVRADAGRRQAGEAVQNFEQLVQVDVRSAYVEVVRARDKAAAVAATRALDETKLEVETQRFGFGQASSFQLARAQRDLVRRQVQEAEAIAEYGQALVELYRLDGSLLERRGIDAPGAEPVAEP
ncbi:MAG TPA: TolC family protein [Candidatus Polarisedimenticolaceae bacterium]|nr:TolC family protein [Candidatus Polarisedimenticolaceae bacterium]